MKLRTLFATPNAAGRKVAFGLGIELSFNDKRWDSTRVTSEYRPIIAWHVNPKVDFIVNPILDTAYDGLKNMVFAPQFAVRVQRVRRVGNRARDLLGIRCAQTFDTRGDQSHQMRRTVSC